MLSLSRSLVQPVVVDYLVEANKYYSGKIYSRKLRSRDKRANSKDQICTAFPTLKSGSDAEPPKPRRAASTVTNRVFYSSLVHGLRNPIIYHCLNFQSSTSPIEDKSTYWISEFIDAHFHHFETEYKHH